MTQQISRIGIVGAGTMGSGIAINALMSGLSVTLVDRAPDVLDAARQKLDRFLARQFAKGRLSQADFPAILSQLHTGTDMSALSTADLVIEAVFEKLELKRSIFREIEAHVAPDAIIASNTSCLRLSAIAEGMRHAARFCGLHYFSPAEINPVVELIQGPATTPEVLSKATDFLRRTGKEVIACKDQSGFALNRFFCPYTNEAVRVLDAGLATTGQIDSVAQAALGVALGPFAVMNIIGTATNLNAVRNLAPLGPFYVPAQGLINHGDRNTPWSIEPAPAPLDAAQHQRIADRLVASVLLPVRELLSEGTATIAAVDRGATLAFRFCRTPGQLLHDLGEVRVAALIDSLTTPA